MADPLVITLKCEGEAWGRCEALRRRYFPAARNVVPAHIALFHHLPGDELADVKNDLAREACAPFALGVTGVRSLGKGAALRVESTELGKVRGRLAQVWDRWLTPQDRAKFSPHITVQNKVSVEQARVTLVELRDSFEPFAVEAVGIDVWHYRGGPWEHAACVNWGESQFGV